MFEEIMKVLAYKKTDITSCIHSDHIRFKLKINSKKTTENI
jgi:hypothetical protein